MADPLDRREGPPPGRMVEVAPGVRRIGCDNPSPMTFTGTQTYVVGQGEVAVIDPGPGDARHVQTLLAALEPGERVVRIVVTHSHADHSPAARQIAALTGAPVAAFGPHGSGMSTTMRALAREGGTIGGGEGADRQFAPDEALGEGDVVEGPDWALEALHTPGHLSNHVSLALRGTGVLFTGDTVMGWATTLVSPPEGDMGQFMATLRRLAERDDRLYLPGHGNPVEDPAAMVRWQIAHREERFAQIMEALAAGPADAEVLARRIYRGIDPRLLPAAARNVLASLIALAEEGQVRAPEGLAADARFERA